MKKHGGLSLPGLALGCALLCAACPFFGSEPDRRAALEALDALGSLDLAIVYQAQGEELWPFPVAQAWYEDARLRLEIDGQAYGLTPGSAVSAIAVPAGSAQILELFWGGSLIWRGSSIARRAPANVSCAPEFSSWLEDGDSTMAVSWQAVSGTDTYECRLVESENHLVEFPLDDEHVWAGAGAALWWTAIPDDVQDGPLLSVRAIDSAVMIEDADRSGRFALRTYGAAAYIGAGAAQKGNP